MNKAGALVRVSTERQLEGTSPEKQLEKIQELAKLQGYSINTEHTWMIAESGAKQVRQGFAQALEAVKVGGITRLYVYSIDRLGRNLTDLLVFLRQMEDLGIEVWSAEKAEVLQENDFLVQIMGAVASLERQQIYRRTQDGLHRAVAAGKYCGGIIAYGYSLNPETKKLEVNENEASVVRMMFNWCVKDKLSCTLIAERLNALQIPTHYTKDKRVIHYKGKREAEKTAGIWRAGRVRNMLVNPAYYGYWVYGKRTQKMNNRISIPGYSPEIISKETFESAAKVLQENRLFFPELPHHAYLLRGLIRCGLCGKAFCGSTSRVGPNKTKEKSYYLCNGKTQWRKLGVDKCVSKSLIAREIEDVVWSDIVSYLKNPEIAIAQLKSMRKPVDDTVPGQIIEIQRQISEYERKETNLIRIAAESHEINLEKVDEMLREYRKQKELLVDYHNQLLQEDEVSQTFESELQDIAERLKNLIENIESTTFEEKRVAVCALVKEIIVTSEALDGKTISVVNIVYRFNELCNNIQSRIPAFIQGCTPAPAVIMGTILNPAPAPPHL